MLKLGLPSCSSWLFFDHKGQQKAGIAITDLRGQAKKTKVFQFIWGLL